MQAIIKLKVLAIIMILISNFSCSNSEPDQPIGLWKDNIKLSQKEAKLSAENNSILITTEGESWWLTDITLNGVNVELDKTITHRSNFVIEKTEFRMERKKDNEIHIQMTKNETGVERVLIIGLEDGDYFDRIKITQSKN
jgi:hypothetical protein